MPSTPPRGHNTEPAAGPGAPAPAVRDIASHTQGRIRRLSGQALRAQANSLPGLACHLLADSRSGRN